MEYSSFSQRLRDLEDNVARETDLLKQYEQQLSYATDPRNIEKITKMEIPRQKNAITSYEKELAELKAQLQQGLANQPSAQIQNESDQMQNIESELQQLNSKANMLVKGQWVIFSNLNQMRKALLDRYDALERAKVNSITQELNQKQLLLTQKLLDALENNQISESEMQQMLAVLKERIPSLPPSQAVAAEIIKAPELDARHKLKLTLPIVPMLVEYEGELELGSGFNIKSAWEQLVAKLRRE